VVVIASTVVVVVAAEVAIVVAAEVVCKGALHRPSKKPESAWSTHLRGSQHSLPSRVQVPPMAEHVLVVVVVVVLVVVVDVVDVVEVG
jgi:hypothetical protein